MYKRLVLAVSLLLAGCESSDVVTGGQCPPPPAVFSAAPVPAMAGQSSVDVELSRTYLLNRVRTMLATDTSGESGAFIGSINLRDEINGSQRRALIDLTLEPWLKGQSGQPASLQRFYKLTLQLTPRLVTATTVTDVNLRRQLLQCDPATDTDCDSREGALLSFDLVSLTNTSFSRPACSSPDVIDTTLVPQIYDLLSKQAPLSLPTDAIATLLSSAAGAPAPLTDVNVSVANGLTLGLQYSLGSTHAFDTQTQLLAQQFPNRDWLVNLDTSIMNFAVRGRMQAELSAKAPGGTITSFNSTFLPGEIRANGTGSVPVPGFCGSSATLTIAARNPMQMCKDAGGQSIIASWTDASASTPNICVNFITFWDNIGIGMISGPPPVWPTLAEVQFMAGPNDTFYGTDLDLNGVFMIAGRSTVMDALDAGSANPLRRPLPGKCPGVP